MTIVTADRSALGDPEGTSVIEFEAVCQATLYETWRAVVPTGLTGEALRDLLVDKLQRGDCDFLSQRADDERDRELHEVFGPAEDEPSHAAPAVQGPESAQQHADRLNRTALAYNHDGNPTIEFPGARVFICLTAAGEMAINYWTGDVAEDPSLATPDDLPPRLPLLLYRDDDLRCTDRPLGA